MASAAPARSCRHVAHVIRVVRAALDSLEDPSPVAFLGSDLWDHRGAPRHRRDITAMAGAITRTCPRGRRRSMAELTALRKLTHCHFTVSTVKQVSPSAPRRGLRACPQVLE